MNREEPLHRQSGSLGEVAHEPTGYRDISDWQRRLDGLEEAQRRLIAERDQARREVGQWQQAWHAAIEPQPNPAALHAALRLVPARQRAQVSAAIEVYVETRLRALAGGR